MLDLITTPEVVDRYLKDESSYTGHAAGVVRAESIKTVAACLRLASKQEIPVTISARRTSLTGAAVPEGGWILVLPEDSSPNLVQIDEKAQEATLPARTLMVDLETAAERAGFFFGPDPTSRKDCSIGGAVACNASGARSFGHGAVGDWVVGLTVVLPTGEILKLRRGEHPPVDGVFTFERGDQTVTVEAPPPRRVGLKTSLGYALFDPPDLLDLFIGSEGTLGYIDSVTVRLLKRRPIFAALVFWDDLDAALSFVEQLQAGHSDAHIKPMSIEWFDQRSLALAGARHPRFNVPSTAHAALFIEQRHAPEDEEAVAMAWYEALLNAGAPDDDTALRIPRTAADLDAFRDFRHAVPESINALARSRGLRKLGTDLAYPAGWLRRMYARYQAAVADVPTAVGSAGADFESIHQHPLPQTLDAAMFGHIGDNHLHVNLLPSDSAEAAAGKILYAELARHCVEVGGSLSGEHGIGKSKRALYASTLSADQLSLMRRIKRCFDPQGVMGQGNLFIGL